MDDRAPLLLPELIKRGLRRRINSHTDWIAGFRSMILSVIWRGRWATSALAVVRSHGSCGRMDGDLTNDLRGPSSCHSSGHHSRYLIASRSRLIVVSAGTRPTPFRTWIEGSDLSPNSHEICERVYRMRKD